MRPVRDPLRSLIFSAAERAVKSVYVDGRQLVNNGRVLTIDVEEAHARLQAAQNQMIADVPSNDFLGRNADDLTPLSLPLPTI